MEILGWVVTILGPLGAYLLKKYVSSLVDADKQKSENEAKKNTLKTLQDWSLRAVRETDIEYVAPKKAKGEFGLAEQKNSKYIAIEKLKSYYGATGILNLAMFFDLNAEQLNKMLDSTIEAAIFRNREGKYAGSSISLSKMK